MSRARGKELKGGTMHYKLTAGKQPDYKHYLFDSPNKATSMTMHMHMNMNIDLSRLEVQMYDKEKRFEQVHVQIYYAFNRRAYEYGTAAHLGLTSYYKNIWFCTEDIDWEYIRNKLKIINTHNRMLNAKD